MDLIQISIIILVLLLGIILSILGIEVLFIMKQLKKDLNKLDLFLDGIEIMGNDKTKVGEKSPKTVVKIKTPQKKFFKKSA